MLIQKRCTITARTAAHRLWDRPIGLSQISPCSPRSDRARRRRRRAEDRTQRVRRSPRERKQPHPATVLPTACWCSVGGGSLHSIARWAARTPPKRALVGQASPGQAAALGQGTWRLAEADSLASRLLQPRRRRRRRRRRHLSVPEPAAGCAAAALAGPRAVGRHPGPAACRGLADQDSAGGAPPQQASSASVCGSCRVCSHSDVARQFTAEARVSCRGSGAGFGRLGLIWFGSRAHRSSPPPGEPGGELAPAAAAAAQPAAPPPPPPPARGCCGLLAISAFSGTSNGICSEWMGGLRGRCCGGCC